MERKRVMVSGCFDMLHSGHVAFLHECANFGELTVCIGSDENVFSLKNRWPLTDQDERAYMLHALSCVKSVRVNTGQGLLDFVAEMDQLRPDVFIVNEDGHSVEKEALCQQRGIEYLVLKREPHATLKPRSTTSLRQDVQIPFRIDLAGGWLDQPWVSGLHPGPVLTISIEPNHPFDDRSGMSSSTRHTAIGLWGPQLPVGDLDRMARVLFCCENPPGTAYVSGSQDSIGIVYPGLNRLMYRGKYWPDSIETCLDEEVLRFLESNIQLVALGQRKPGYDVLTDTRVDEAGAAELAAAAEEAWSAALARDASRFGAAFTRSFRAQTAMFPNMVDDVVREAVSTYQHGALGHKLSGAGGGGYLILFGAAEVRGSIRVGIRRKAD